MAENKKIILRKKNSGNPPREQSDSNQTSGKTEKAEKENTTMANETVGQTGQTVETKEDRAAKLAAFKAANPSKVEVIEGSMQAAENAGSGFRTVEAETGEVKQVEDKDFPVSQFSQAGIQGYTVVMSYSDVRDYIGFARDLYDVPEGKTDKDVDVSDTWQRNLSNTRAKAIGNYLNNELHFLPPVICVPSYDDSVRLEKTNDGGGIYLRIGGAGIAALDGQHRVAGIKTALQNSENGTGLETESIPVVILMLDDLDKRQQIFADVNRTPKTVSKALNLMFDHRDSVVILARQISDTPDFHNIVYRDGLTPTKSSNCALSVTNLYNFLSKFINMKDATGMPIFSNELAGKIASAVINNFNDIRRIRVMNETYGQVRSAYLCYSSTAWQALGTVVNKLANSKHADGSNRFNVDDMPTVMERVMQTTDWRLENPRWHETNRRVVIDSKVGTRTENITALVEIIVESQLSQ